MNKPSTPFGYISPNPQQEKIMKLARIDAEQLLSRADSLPDSRYKSLFVTTLESTMMWFNKAATRSASLPPEPPLFEEPTSRSTEDDSDG